MVIISIIWRNVGVTEFQNQFSVFEIAVIYLQSQICDNLHSVLGWEGDIKSSHFFILREIQC